MKKKIDNDRNADRGRGVESTDDYDHETLLERGIDMPVSQLGDDDETTPVVPQPRPTKRRRPVGNLFEPRLDLTGGPAAVKAENPVDDGGDDDDDPLSAPDDQLSESSRTRHRVDAATSETRRQSRESHASRRSRRDDDVPPDSTRTMAMMCDMFSTMSRQLMGASVGARRPTMLSDDDDDDDNFGRRRRRESDDEGRRDAPKKRARASDVRSRGRLFDYE